MQDSAVLEGLSLDKSKSVITRYLIALLLLLIYKLPGLISPFTLSLLYSSPSVQLLKTNQHLLPPLSSPPPKKKQLKNFLPPSSGKIAMYVL